MCVCEQKGGKLLDDVPMFAGYVRAILDAVFASLDQLPV